MYNPTTRLLTILELLQSRGEVSGADLAQALEVEERSIRRYIMMLRDIGIPIEGSRGRHGGYSLRPGFRLPPLMFTADEITAVMMGLMLMRAMGSTSLQAIESAAAKITRVLPDNLRQVTDAMQNALVLNDVERGAHRVHSETLLRLSRATHTQHCVTIVYQAGEGQETERLIAPYGLVLHARRWYVPAYCSLRKDVRVFRLDRVRRVIESEQSFQRPDNFDARGAVLDSLAQMRGTFLFEVLFHAGMQTVEASMPEGLGVLEARGEETVMRCYSDDPHWIARQLLAIDVPFNVLGPEELRVALHLLADDILATTQR